MIEMFDLEDKVAIVTDARRIFVFKSVGLRHRPYFYRRRRLAFKITPKSRGGIYQWT